MSSILITGANRGIGLALVRVFLDRGHNLIATARDLDSASELGALIEAHGPTRLAGIALDLTHAASVAAAAKQITAARPALDVLINNAGVYPEGGDEPFEEISPETFQRAMEVNYLGAIRATQALLPLIRKGVHPRILNISSGAATLTTKSDSRRYCYGPSKTALNMFTRTLAHELKESGIVVAALSPGWVRTDMGGPDADLSVEEAASEVASTVENLSTKESGLFLDRFGDPDVYAW